MIHGSNQNLGTLEQMVTQQIEQESYSKKASPYRNGKGMHEIGKEQTGDNKIARLFFVLRQ